MPHLAREQRLATLDGHCLGLGNPNEGEYALRTSAPTPMQPLLMKGQNLRGQETER
jgi:hypothetical protein